MDRLEAIKSERMENRGAFHFLVKLLPMLDFVFTLKHPDRLAKRIDRPLHVDAMQQESDTKFRH